MCDKGKKEIEFRKEREEKNIFRVKDFLGCVNTESSEGITSLFPDATSRLPMGTQLVPPLSSDLRRDLFSTVSVL